MAHDVFISYSTKDKTVADTVCAKLEERKIRCWIAPRDIAPGQHFAKSIIDAIDLSKVFVLIWSANANISEHILNEINQAFNQGITIIPFRIQDVQPTSEMRYYFGRTHWLDALTKPLEKHIDSLAAFILPHLGRKEEEPLPVETSPSRDTKEIERAAIMQPGDDSQVRQEEKTRDKNTARGKRAENSTQPPGRKGGRKWIFPVLGACAVSLALLTWLIVSDRLTNLPGTQSTQSSPSTQTTTRTPTTAPSRTITPVPAWVNDFGAPILAAIADRPPDWEYDFSSYDPDWSFGLSETAGDCSISIYEIRDKALYLGAGPFYECSTTAELEISLSDYVLQVDMDLSQEDPSYKAEVAIDNVDIIDLFRDGYWEIVDCMVPDCRIAYSGRINFDPTKPVTIKFISYEKRNAVYINDFPAYYYILEEPEVKNNLRFVIANVTGTSVISNNSVTYDNLLIWNLDAIEGLATMIK